MEHYAVFAPKTRPCDLGATVKWRDGVDPCAGLRVERAGSLEKAVALTLILATNTDTSPHELHC